MFNIFTLAFGAVALGIFLAVLVTRQKSGSPALLLPPEDDSVNDTSKEKKLELEDLFNLGEKLCEENHLKIKDKVKIDEFEYYWMAESENHFFFGTYVLGFLKTTKEKPYVSLPKIFEFKDFVKSATSTKGLFFTTGFFTKDVLQPLEGPKVSLYNKTKVIQQLNRLKMV